MFQPFKSFQYVPYKKQYICLYVPYKKYIHMFHTKIKYICYFAWNIFKNIVSSIRVSTLN